MGRTVGIGIQDFEKIIKNNFFYVDKTSFIKEWWESGDDVTLITRPRRFGKTLNLNMLDYFFSNRHAGRSDLFEGLFIWEDEKYRELQGSYPVISLSFADIKQTNYKLVREKICELLTGLYSKHSYLRESEVLTARDREFFDKVSVDMGDVTAASALQCLSDYLYRYYGKKVIILLDEYDTPMQEAYVNGFWEELVAFTRSMFNSTFKTNPYMLRAIMTGVTRVSKESIFSDLNNLTVVTTTSNRYASSFGFTEGEVFTGLEECGFEKEKEQIKYWYDGFTFGNCKDIYNPWSVLNFLATGVYDTYWANTSGNRLAGKLIREGNENIKTAFGALLNGESICFPIDEQIVYNQLDENEDAVFSLLLASGYLKVLSYDKLNEISASQDPIYELTLTNYEVKRMFYRLVKDWFGTVKREYHGFLKAMLTDDLEAMNEYMNEITMGIFSYFDVGSKTMRSATERFYHGFVLGILVELRDSYQIRSNRESGLGRYDVMLEPKNKNGNAIIIEFKVFNPRREKTLEDTVAAALQQIEEKQYKTEFIAKGFLPEQIRNYGFAFEGKNVLIG